MFLRRREVRLSPERAICDSAMERIPSNVPSMAAAMVPE